MCMWLPRKDWRSIQAVLSPHIQCPQHRVESQGSVDPVWHSVGSLIQSDIYKCSEVPIGEYLLIQV